VKEVRAFGPCLSPKDTADYLDIALQTLRNWTSSRKITSVKFGNGKVVYAIAELEEFIRVHRRAAV
jgi:predicted site-specific integrase-resolvase